jgi:hypothetical protein
MHLKVLDSAGSVGDLKPELASLLDLPTVRIDAPGVREALGGNPLEHDSSTTAYVKYLPIRRAREVGTDACGQVPPMAAPTFGAQIIDPAVVA